MDRFELVHHIDGDSWNDTLDNYAIVSPKEHQRLHAKQKPLHDMQCPGCQLIFKPTRIQLCNWTCRQINDNLRFCSRKCSSRYYSQLKADSRMHKGGIAQCPYCKKLFEYTAKQATNWARQKRLGTGFKNGEHCCSTQCANFYKYRGCVKC